MATNNIADLTQCVITPAVSTEGFDPLGVAMHRASAIVFKDAANYESRGERGHKGYSYGLHGTPTTRTLEEKLTRLGQGARTFLMPSGQAAIPGCRRPDPHRRHRLSADARLRHARPCPPRRRG